MIGTVIERKGSNLFTPMGSEFNNVIYELLRSLEQGQFQQLCKSLLPLINHSYAGLESHGMTLDGKTRKGTPDLIRTFSNGKQIAVQCSVSKDYWKIPHKNIKLSKSKPCIDINKCVHHLDNLQEIVLCSTQSVPTNIPNAKARILKYAQRQTKTQITLYSGSDICEILNNNLNNRSFEPLFQAYFPFLYKSFIHPAPIGITWNELINACRSQVEGEIRSKIGVKYIPKLYVQREKEGLINTFIESGTTELLENYKVMQTIVHNLFDRTFSYIVDIGLLDNQYNIFLPHIERKKFIRLFLDNLLKSLLKKRRLLTSRILGSAEKEIWNAMASLENQIHQMQSSLSGLFLIIDRAGSGKTNILCHLAEKYAQMVPTIFITGRFEVSDEFSIENYIKNKLNYYQSFPFQRCFEDINHLVAENDKTFLIIIDAINEGRDIVLLEQAISNLINMNIDKNIKFIISCRDIYWEYFKDDIWKSFYGKIENVLYELTENEFRIALPAYLEHYQIHCKLDGDARKKCQQPLLLRFFCETYGDPYAPNINELETVSEIRLRALFDKYTDKKCDSISKTICLRDNQLVLDYMFRIVHSMREGFSKSLLSRDIGKITGDSDIYSLRSIYTLILDEDIIIEERPINDSPEKQVMFVYEEFMEYLMAREIVRDFGWNQKNEEYIVRESKTFIESYKAYRNLRGILEYLGIMMKEDRNINILNALLKYPARYGLTICRCIRKLALANVDYSMILTLEKMLLSMKTVKEDIGGEIIGIFAKEKKEWGDEIVNSLLKLTIATKKKIYIPAMSMLVEMRSEKAIKGLERALLHCIGTFPAKEYYSEKLIIVANIFGIQNYKEGIPILIRMLRRTEIDVVNEAIKALGVIGEGNVIKALLDWIPEIWKKVYGKFESECLIGESMEEIVKALKCLVERRVILDDRLKNAVNMIINDKGESGIIMELVAPGLENVFSIELNLVNDYLEDRGVISPERATEAFEFSLQVRRAIRMLTPREENIISMRFGINAEPEGTWAEIGAKLGICESTVKRNYRKAMDKLRRPPISMLLKDFCYD